MATTFTDTYLELDEQGTAPSNPSSGKRRIYVDASGVLRIKDSSGNTPLTGATQLDDLTDAAITSPSTAEVLRYNGSAFANAGLAIGDIGDFNISGPSNDEVLKYDDGTSKWINGTVSSVAAINDLTDVTITSGNNGDQLVLASGTWVNKKPHKSVFLKRIRTDPWILAPATTLQIPVLDKGNTNIFGDSILVVADMFEIPTGENGLYRLEVDMQIDGSSYSSTGGVVAGIDKFEPSILDREEWDSATISSDTQYMHYGVSLFGEAGWTYTAYITNNTTGAVAVVYDLTFSKMGHS